METFRITKKKYDWIVRHNEHDYDLTPDRRTAIAAGRRRARDVVAAGGQAEVLLINTVGMWDNIGLEDGEVD